MIISMVALGFSIDGFEIPISDHLQLNKSLPSKCVLYFLYCSQKNDGFDKPIPKKLIGSAEPFRTHANATTESGKNINVNKQQFCT